MFLYDKTNILEGLGIFEVDFAQGHEPANMVTAVSRCHVSRVTCPGITSCHVLDILPRQVTTKREHAG